MMLWLVMPVLLPLLTAALLVLLRNRASMQMAVSLVAAVAMLLVAVVLLSHADAAPQVAFGEWPAPYGIVFAVDRLSAVMLAVTALMTLVTLVYMCADLGDAPRHPLLLSLLFGMIAGVNGAFLTADIFNWYVWFEVMLICSLGLLAIGQRGAQLDAAFKYMALNLPGTLLMLFAVAMVYGATGQLNFAALHEAQAPLPQGTGMWLLALLVIAFLVKAGAFPVFAWLPASYHTLPVPLLALFAALLTKVGAYALLRILGEVFQPDIALVQEVLGWLAVATMVFGVIGAAYHWDMRRILAFHIISQIGYILLAVALGGVLADAAGIFYIVHHIIVKANLFLIAGLICAYAGSHDLRKIGGLYNAKPWLALLFAVPALSLVGIPPMSGFWAKLLLLRETIATGHVWWTVAALLVSVLTMYSMMKIWLEAFVKAHPNAAEEGLWQPRAVSRPAPAVLAVVILAGLTLWISVWPQALYGFAQAAAEALAGGP
ncbi:hypothetical protein KRX19_08315 [Cardiobacteriaceae bacterium TAE3-ERU3]|nr:hypothetical protein [Cardiobacteriaceae bacterium TAE3-ERU3]